MKPNQNLIKTLAKVIPPHKTYGILFEIYRYRQKILKPQSRLSYFVLNILDHCNLCCKGCDHFSSIAEERFVSIENIQRDLARMSYITDGKVGSIGIMGGEPLLHPELIRIFEVARKSFPSAGLNLVTNGILLLQQKEIFWDACRQNNIEITVTKYPIHLDYERIIRVASSNQVTFSFYGNTNEVQKSLHKVPIDITGRQNAWSSFLHCFHAGRCHLLMEGKFYPCTIMPNIIHFNKRFGTNLNIMNSDYLDIYMIDNISELMSFLSVPKPFCRYCNTKERTFGNEWERSKMDISEWT